MKWNDPARASRSHHAKTLTAKLRRVLLMSRPHRSELRSRNLFPSDDSSLRRRQRFFFSLPLVSSLRLSDSFYLSPSLTISLSPSATSIQLLAMFISVSDDFYQVAVTFIIMYMVIPGVLTSIDRYFDSTIF